MVLLTNNIAKYSELSLATGTEFTQQFPIEKYLDNIADETSTVSLSGYDDRSELHQWNKEASNSSGKSYGKLYKQT